MITGIKMDVSRQVAGLEKLLGDDLPFTIALFLTYQAQSGQAAARVGERNVFKLRNDWTTMNTRITPARKTTPFSEVFTDTSNRKTDAPDYLPRQDAGGEKVPIAGHNFLAIPTRYLRKVATGVIPDALRPRNLLPPGMEIGVKYEGTFNNKGVRPRRGLSRPTRKTLASNEYTAFIQSTKSGTLCIFVRHGGMGFHAGSMDAEPWYTLIRSAHIQPRFPMEQLVQQAVAADLDKNFTRAAAEVLVNNLMQSGFQVRF